MVVLPAETFTEVEREKLAPYFTNWDRHIFALTNLPETVKGALFARYSRSAKSLRRLFLDEFADSMPPGGGAASSSVGVERAEKLYARVFNEYGDDSVAQLGGAHIACEYASNILTKVLEWGRLMAYLEQSTRYVPYTDKLLGRWRYHVPFEVTGGLRDHFTSTMDRAFELYAKWIPVMQDHFAARYPKSPTDSEAVHRAAIRAKALDTLRGMLPAATQSNVGIYGTGQAYEALMLRMRAHPLSEVTLTSFDPDGEVKVAAAALYAVSGLPDDQLLTVARRMTADQRAAVIRAYAGDRTNRRHRPGRAFERTSYRFDVLTDYGAFRDLQRHRLLTLEWQRLTPRHGYTEPEAIREAGAGSDWDRVMDASGTLHDALAAAGLADAAQYAVAMAYRVRFYMDMNAREAMHLIELRTAPQGHPAYRRVCQQMHTLIADQAGHRAIADAMQFVDHSEVELERLGSERQLEKKRSS